MSHVTERQPARVAEPQRSPPLKVHNDLIGDRAALDRAWETDGYWFFKNVLDLEPVERLRRIMVQELEKLGVVEPGAGDQPADALARYNGADLSGVSFRLETLAEGQPWRDFVSHPSIHDLMVKLLGDEPFWVPIVEYRTIAPVADKAAPRFTIIHQDGPNALPGLPFRVFWVPLCKIDHDVGGMALAEGMTEEIDRHVASGSDFALIPLEAIPTERWRQTISEPGDLLIMNQWVPHCSVTNHSDRFRLSLDLRVMRQSENVPLIGELLSITAEGIELRHEGGDVSLKFSENAFYRMGYGERRRIGDDVVNYFKPGDRVICGCDGDKVINFRVVLV